jgi:glutamate carboxypeptidase
VNNLSDTADALREFMSERSAQMLDLLQQLVSIESHATQPAGVDAVASRVVGVLVDAGFTVERRQGEAIPAADAWLADLMLPGADFATIADVLILRKSGVGAGRVLLLGDLDTSFEGGSSRRSPFQIDRQRAVGPGVADMKGGLVVLAYALLALARIELSTPAGITVVLSPDEQAGSLRSRRTIEDEARTADWCLCLECARDGGNLMGSRAHIGVARLEVYGREAHAGTAHAAGASAIEAIARMVCAVNALTSPTRHIYVTVGQIHGGRRRSVVPGHAYCTIDIRTPDATAWNEVERSLREVARHIEVRGTHAELRMRAHRPGVAWDAATDDLISVVRRAGDLLRVPFGVITSSAAGSSSFAGALGVPVLDGMGPAGGDLMTDREYIEIPSLAERAALLALTVHLLGGVQE